jgi:hypothetical protein
MTTMHQPIVSTGEIADYLGVTSGRVSQLAKRDDFPTPYVVLKVGPIWKREPIMQWAASWERRVGRPRKVAS